MKRSILAYFKKEDACKKQIATIKKLESDCTAYNGEDTEEKEALEEALADALKTKQTMLKDLSKLKATAFSMAEADTDD